MWCVEHEGTGGRGVILLDTFGRMFDAMTPERRSKRAGQAIESGDAGESLACAEISLSEM